MRHCATGLLAVVLASSAAAVDQDFAKKFSVDTNLVTGVFGSKEPNKSGFVVPWKLKLKGGFQADPALNIAVELDSQTGINRETGPFIAGFARVPNIDLRINHIKIAYAISPSSSLMLALGKVKPDLRKHRAITTPLPFSSATQKPPLGSNEFVANWQHQGLLPRHSITLGYGISNIASVASTQDRIHSIFIENSYQLDANSNAWIHYVKNNLSRTYDVNKKHYFSIGADRKIGQSLLNAAVAAGNLAESGGNMSKIAILGFDAGAKVDVAPLLPNGSFAVGYAYSRDKNRNIEVSYTFKPYASAKFIMSVYQQKDYNDSTQRFGAGYFVAGLKIEQQLLSL